MAKIELKNAEELKKATATTENAKPQKVKKDAQGRTYGTGRRKDSVARVWLKAGSGNIIVNGKDIADYFSRGTLRQIILSPFAATNTLGNFDIYCTVKGGGHSGQAGAIKHGLSRALDAFDSEFHSVLRKEGFLTRDPRVVERKKYGRHKARKSTQFSKR